MPIAIAPPSTRCARPRSGARPRSTELTEAVAKNLFKLMAYKDEYEVARLYTDGSSRRSCRSKFDGDYTAQVLPGAADLRRARSAAAG